MPQWTGVPTTPGQQQQRSASAGGTVVVAVRQRTAGAAAAGPAGPSTGSSPQALLDAAPPTIVAALAEQLGVTQAGLTQVGGWVIVALAAREEAAPGQGCFRTTAQKRRQAARSCLPADPRQGRRGPATRPPCAVAQHASAVVILQLLTAPNLLVALPAR